jgi:hypothetical protein
MMSSVGWAILLVGLALAADVGWAEYREWRRRRDAARRGTTLTQKFGLRDSSSRLNHRKASR